MPASEDQDEMLSRAAASAQWVLAQVRDQLQDLDSNRYIDAAVSSKGSNLLTGVEQSLVPLLDDLNGAQRQMPQTDQR